MNHPLVLFDGICNLCNGAVAFLIRHDKTGQLHFASLQSSAGQQLLLQYGLSQSQFQSFILIQNEKIFQQSAAALKLIPYLRWYWQWAKILWLAPPFLRNGIYKIISKNRYRWFGKKEACMVPTPALQQRFLQ